SADANSCSLVATAFRFLQNSWRNRKCAVPEGIEPMDIFSPDSESARLGLLCVSPNAPPRRPSFFDFAFLYSHSPRPHGMQGHRMERKGGGAGPARCGLVWC